MATASAALAALLFCAPAFARPAKEPEPDVPVEAILAAYDHATHADDVKSYVAEGTIEGEGLRGSFRTVRVGTNEREDDVFGPQRETTLRLGDRLFVRNANGNVRELRGYLHRRALTEDLIDSGTIVEHPEFARFAGWGNVGSVHVWRLEVNATGGEPETLWIDPASGLPLRMEFLDGDGPSFVDYADWREINGRRIPFRSVVTDGDHRFDTIQQTTRVTLDQAVDEAAFAPLQPRLLLADRVHTVPLIERDGHVGVTVRCANRDWFFLLDTGAQSIVVDGAVLKAAGAAAQGALEVRGAVRTGGMRLATLPRLEIDGVAMTDVAVSSIPLGSIGNGFHIDGILGYPFFASGLVEMDFAKRVLRFGDPGSFVPRGARLDLDVDRELAETSLTANGVRAPFIVDTGNSSEMLLYRTFVEAHPGLVPSSMQNSWNYGIGGANATYRTSLAELDLGGVALYQRGVDVVLATNGAFADRVDAGNIGLGVLRNFIATFDLGNAAMYLERGADFDDGRSRVAHSATSS